MAPKTRAIVRAFSPITILPDDLLLRVAAFNLNAAAQLAKTCRTLRSSLEPAFASHLRFEGSYAAFRHCCGFEQHCGKQHVSHAGGSIRARCSCTCANRWCSAKSCRFTSSMQSAIRRAPHASAWCGPLPTAGKVRWTVTLDTCKAPDGLAMSVGVCDDEVHAREH